MLLFSLLFGFALHAVGERARPIYDFIDRLSQVLFRIVGFVMRLAPLGAFGAMAPMTLLDQLILLAVLLLTSKGAAGVTGSGFIVLAATLSVLGTLPVTALALILGIDRFMSEARALTNLVGNGVATVVVANGAGRWMSSACSKN